MRLRRTLLLAAAMFACASANAFAATKAQLHVGFSPEHPGASTTFSLRFQIGSAQAPTVAHLTSVGLHLPTGVVSASSTLGPETCTGETLELRGASGCPPNAIVGTGKAVISVRLGPENVHQTVSLVILMAPSKPGQT